MTELNCYLGVEVGRRDQVHVHYTNPHVTKTDSP